MNMIYDYVEIYVLDLVFLYIQVFYEISLCFCLNSMVSLHSEGEEKKWCRLITTTFRKWERNLDGSFFYCYYLYKFIGYLNKLYKLLIQYNI